MTEAYKWKNLRKRDQEKVRIKMDEVKSIKRSHKDMPAGKAGTGQKFPCGFSHSECGNTDPKVCCA